MTIDKSWTRIRNRNCQEFFNGLDAFLETCKDHLNTSNTCRCPCERCDNQYYASIASLRNHIHRNGFSSAYNIWRFHGEQFIIPTSRDDLRQPRNGLHDYLDDVRQENNTNEPNTDTDEQTVDVGNTNDELSELYKMAAESLYPGCEMSWLDFVAKLAHIKVINKWTDTSYDQTVELLRKAFPTAKIPSSHYESKKVLKKAGLGYIPIHACKNDCCLFWDDKKDLQSCPICLESRWKDKNTKGKKVANKVLRYFPLTPRLKRLYSSRHTAKHMTWHATGQCREDGKMRHPVDGTAWKHFDATYPDFAEEPRNVRLGLSADGFNPYGNMSTSYSMWPVILTTYNTPPWLCMKESSLMLTLLIPGPKSPGKDIDVFLKPLVDELKSLWSEGVRTKDAATGNFFTMKAMLLWTINDYPARSSLSGWSGQGYLACPTCNVDTPSIPVQSKIAYVGHRRFLGPNHHWRKNKSFNGKDESRPPPKKLSKIVIIRQLSKLTPCISGKHVLYGGKKRKRDTSVELNWSKRSIFFELEYWSSLQLKHNLDVMHIEKNVCDSLLNILLMHEKSKDTNKARKDLEKMNIRPELWLKDNGRNRVLKPHPKYSFSTENIKLFCKFIKGVKLPDGFGSNFRKKVHENDTSIGGLKSHDHHIMMQRLLPLGVDAYLDSDISTPIIELCFFFKQICSRNLMTSDMKKAEKQLINILCTFEQIFPPAFFDIMIHLVIHLPQEAIQGGPVYMRWMYPFERYMKKLKNYVRNQARPEGSIAEGYVAEEALTFCSRYLEDVSTRFNRPDRNEDTPIPRSELYVFQSVCTPISKSVDVPLDHVRQTQINWFVLNNSHEIDQYKTDFNAEMPPGGTLQTHFPRWFKNKINCLRASNDSRCSKELFALANGPNHANTYTACIVNGVRFVVQNRDLRRTTQNSGISTTGPDGTIYYGQLEEILVMTYISGYNVALFRCKWFKTDTQQRCVTKNNITSISTQTEWFTEEPYILATQANLVFYLDKPSKSHQRGESSQHYWKVVQQVNHRKIWDRDIIAEDDERDVIHDNNSSDLSLSANFDYLTYTSLSMGQSIEVEYSSTHDNENIIVDDDDDDDDIDDADDFDLDVDDDNSDFNSDNECEPHGCSSDESD